MRIGKIVCTLLVVALPVVVWKFVAGRATTAQANIEADAAAEPAAHELPIAAGMTCIPASAFSMGAATALVRDQGPAHEVRLDSFWIDTEPVTNAQFAKFVDATHYLTTAERRGTSLVFDATQHRWREVSGACWRAPLGERSSLVGRDRYPVVHVSWHDARAYTEWAGKRLPSEAEFECAARGGLLSQTYAWGNTLAPDGAPMANFWQGPFPNEDRGLDTFRDVAPVGRFPANRWGLIDMAGNTWCWTADGYAADYYQYSPPLNPPGPLDASERVLRGGSYLTTAEGLTVATRNHAPPDHSAGDIGFRCAR